MTSKSYWNFAFAAGSTLAAFCQGVILGGLIQGIKVENGVFAGGPFDWATPFALLCGLGVMAGYALLGATWLVMKTDGTVAERARDQAKVLLLGVLALHGGGQPLDAARVRAHRGALVLDAEHLLPLAGTAAHRAHRADGLALARGAAARCCPSSPSIVLFLLGYLGLVISTFPYLVPPTLTLWQTAAAPASQLFMLTGTLVLLPIILGYIVFVYWIFRGKVREGEGYH